MQETRSLILNYATAIEGCAISSFNLPAQRVGQLKIIGYEKDAYEFCVHWEIIYLNTYNKQNSSIFWITIRHQ